MYVCSVKRAIIKVIIISLSLCAYCSSSTSQEEQQQTRQYMLKHLYDKLCKEKNKCVFHYCCWCGAPNRELVDWPPTADPMYPGSPLWVYADVSWPDDEPPWFGNKP
jgi:hypothetical protein